MKTDNYANQMERNVEVDNTTGINLRSGSRTKLNEHIRRKVAKSSFRVDAAKLWNLAADLITRETTKNKAKGK